MNRIIVDKESKIELKDNIFDLEINVDDLEIDVSGRVLINEFSVRNNERLNLKIVLKENSTLVYNRFAKHSIIDNNVVIEQNSKSDVTFNYSYIAFDKCKLNIDSILFGDDNNTVIKVKSVSKENGSNYIKSTADVKKNVKNNSLIENLRVLTLNDEEQTIIPNLLVSSNEVEANHAATISSVSPEYLFYLNSKGISNDDATKLITDGYLLSNLYIDEEQKDQLRELI